MEQTYFPHDKEDAAMKHTVTLSNGVSVPALGQGTWYLGDAEETRTREIDALRAGIEAGMTLLDTAENYGDGRSETLVGEAIRPYPREALSRVEGHAVERVRHTAHAVARPQSLPPRDGLP